MVALSLMKRNKTMRINYNANLNDIKYDLLKISEPYDGVLWQEDTADGVVKLFTAYLNDMCRFRNAYKFDVSYVRKETSYTFDIGVQLSPNRSMKKLKIHVGIYQSKWPLAVAA